VREVRSGEISVDGLRSPLIEAGSPDNSEAVVFLHGNPGSRLDWEDLVGQVGEFGRALAFDMPGFGQSDKRRNFGGRVEDYASYIDGALDGLGVRRAHLVVHDFGGAFGFCWAAANPDALGSVVMFNTGTWTTGRWHQAARLWRRPVVGELVMALTNRRTWRKRMSAGPDPLPIAFIDRMYDDFDRGTRRAVLRLYRATPLPYPPASGWVATLAKLDRPALIAWGANDPFLGRRRVEDLKQPFPSAEVVMLDGSGHFPFADDPERSAQAIVPFLRSRLDARVPA
jgi:Predicted hydrolases or acyltransferases (alpha/beta hydrolase superfamily)